MADPRKKLPANVAGEFFVDSTCINCDTCRQLAPESFAEEDGYSCVSSQPRGDNAVRLATRALLACPTGSIGTTGKNIAKDVMSDFPLRLEENVFYCGFNSPNSYGGNSYFVQTPEGNWLIDSPKFLPQLVKQFHDLGGIAFIFLTHRDDVADAELYAAEFGSKRIIHKADQSAQRGAEIVLAGEDDVELAPKFISIATPGHTAGHCVLLYRDKYLFTGDHLAWDRDTGELACFPDHCWYSWSQQKESLAKLIPYTFEWVLPGHGQRIKLPAGQMRIDLQSLCERMKQV